MKQQATQMMWFYDRQQEQWSLSDHASYQLWQGESAHPWAGQLAADDEPGFSDFLSRLYHSHQPAQFIGHLNDEEGSVRHVLWSGQYIPAQQVCCGWLAPLDTTRSTPLPAELSQQLPLLQDPLLAQLAQALSARTGLDFFDTLVNQLAHILVADAVWLAERTGSDRLKVLACHGIDLKEYELAGMPCQQVYRRGEACVVTIESHCQLNPQLKAGQRYYAQPLFDRNGQILGHLALLFSGEIEIPNLGSVLTIFSVRMVAELERLQSDAQLRLSAVAFETHEGIIITDPDFKILRVNHAFSQITGFDSQRVIGLHLGNELWSGLDGLGYELNTLNRWQGETQRLHFDGHIYPQWEIVTPVQDDKGVISHFVICFEDISERKAAERRIQDLAYYDELTGLPNRRQLHETLAQAFSEASRDNLIGALLFIDLDHFKTINDSLGHATGDWLLKEVSSRLKRLVRQGDCLARLGGDEFVLLLPSLSASPPQAEMQADLIAERLISEIAAPYNHGVQVLHIGASVGITLFPGREQGVDDLLKQADTAMYQAKSAGRKTRRFFDASMQQQADRRLLIHNELRNALSQQELTLYYQPQHMVEGGDIIGVEALIRWQPPGRALVSPAEFIPIAEETDLIVDIGNWVLHEACAQYVLWEENGIHIPQLSVNVSAKQFHATDFVECIHDVLAATGMDPACLNLEITESVVLGHAEDTISKMSELKAIGISFAIDDFGAGYSSLSYLKRLPADELKIDRSFIQDIPKDGDNMAIVEAVIAMARHMGFNVTAEGVESRQQLEFLQAQGCHFYQGYLASKPLPVPYLERYVLRLTHNDNTCVVAEK
ncbi:putative bifunctional diguanylate cyclase/phosphodiesterase [Aeromonas salmonicida]|uniref:putative bifunctional diguanylate cyclase/phosphodiesterase n=1 Tax=Aeromonas salmonicida TaxID=645 RepID=UPI00073BC322|nr:EAL domain-containing protein [Aeromonas salmonicida]KTA81890.1 diguanylate phosphodiesterase [Aeromonas salmonicida]MDE7527397.1 EAL domain-containing protein [Aeromonas salmonicida]MDE7531834.1 EAL domain-containing protein [Aeromonas salmonicida]